MRSDKDYLSDILAAILQIEKYTALGRPRFEADELVQTFMVHQIMIIGEAARNLTEALKAKAPGIEWPSIIGMRNRLVHAYFQINVVEVWNTVERDVPNLKPQIEALLKVEDSR